ncbi:uncharacterized protein N7498_007145 [Penicillium cinerascens]|uniref:Uncharacterized protein n=1 Tax=Penicillium cinerascens TaxID=70096 RepID=A0A9W9JJE1_9EURO|nr:uncharacterized protein N7498_007145 [Penicillium cinerascens]KAJ5198028.1 hypothetical protein N7498_007145 [Penicillium cinerascens]
MFGLPLEQETIGPTTGKSDRQAKGTISPLAYARGVRDATYGLPYQPLQAEGQEVAIATFTGIFSITAVAYALIAAGFGGV